MDEFGIPVEEFINAIKEFKNVSDQINDGWRIYENQNEIHKSYLKKESFVNFDLQGEVTLCKVEYNIFYNVSYAVPSFSFNVWRSNGTLLTIEEIRQLSFIHIKREEFYSVITQQEHPLFGRPYFIMHPCHTAQLLAQFRLNSRNIIVTFLSLITPLLKLELPLEYGL
ncbi:PREDICTED: ubiquitin-like-conjugating enzyme ATG10 [Papilio xuthus]|uniref:Ubiquitin-like-conjugating enzyme ATG10 n=1 Tax=Papilio xuthus TaxID=66420 RepID=A0A194Q0D0_PAPXU|nr:PREDICTED: ubiquitin-like-conjugating enzyme ATG10 [Papilio xuthus]KPI96870.1 Ubiquitin-like-conjugating enzyme ATG10 [Papilio xuthus]